MWLCIGTSSDGSSLRVIRVSSAIINVINLNTLWRRGRALSPVRVRRSMNSRKRKLSVSARQVNSAVAREYSRTSAASQNVKLLNPVIRLRWDANSLFVSGLRALMWENVVNTTRFILMVRNNKRFVIVIRSGSNLTMSRRAGTQFVLSSLTRKTNMLSVLLVNAPFASMFVRSVNRRPHALRLPPRHVIHPLLPLHVIHPPHLRHVIHPLPLRVHHRLRLRLRVHQALVLPAPRVLANTPNHAHLNPPRRVAILHPPHQVVILHLLLRVVILHLLHPVVILHLLRVAHQVPHRIVGPRVVANMDPEIRFPVVRRSIMTI